MDENINLGKFLGEADVRVSLSDLTNILDVVKVFICDHLFFLFTEELNKYHN